ncbi:hypothetical protein IFM89_005435, partial [Coptis chinensis]
MNHRANHKISFDPNEGVESFIAQQIMRLAEHNQFLSLSAKHHPTPPHIYTKHFLEPQNTHTVHVGTNCNDDGEHKNSEDVCEVSTLPRDLHVNVGVAALAPGMSYFKRLEVKCEDFSAAQNLRLMATGEETDEAFLTDRVDRRKTPIQSRGLSRGLWLLWDSDIDVQVLYSDQWIIHAVINESNGVVWKLLRSWNVKTFGHLDHKLKQIKSQIQELEDKLNSTDHTTALWENLLDAEMKLLQHHDLILRQQHLHWGQKA